MIKQIKVNPLVFIYLLICLYFQNLGYYLLFFICLIIHELGHIFFIVLNKGMINKIYFNVFGGVIDYKIKNENNKIWISLGRNII